MALSNERLAELRGIALQVRKDVVTMVHAAACGHPGGPLGMADFMTVLFMEHLRLDPENLHMLYLQELLAFVSSSSVQRKRALGLLSCHLPQSLLL